MTCDTPHTEAVIQSGQCGDCGAAWCQNCEAILRPGDGRYEENGPGEPSYVIRGCVACLSGRGVHRYADDLDAARDAEVDRRLDEQREGCGCDFS